MLRARNGALTSNSRRDVDACATTGEERTTGGSTIIPWVYVKKIRSFSEFEIAILSKLLVVLHETQMNMFDSFCDEPSQSAVLAQRHSVAVCTHFHTADMMCGPIFIHSSCFTILTKVVILHPEAVVFLSCVHDLSRRMTWPLLS